MQPLLRKIINFTSLLTSNGPDVRMSAFADLGPPSKVGLQCAAYLLFSILSMDTDLPDIPGLSGAFWPTNFPLFPAFSVRMITSFHDRLHAVDRS